MDDGTVIQTRDLNEVISSHDLRKTFYTNLLQKNVPIGVIESMTHPQRKLTAMSKYYNKLSLLDKAKTFVDEINKINSSIYYF